MTYLQRFTLLLLFTLPVLSWSQVYEIGDTLSAADQQLEFAICANGNGQSTLSLADYNYALNGGEHFVIWLDIFAAD